MISKMPTFDPTSGAVPPELKKLRVMIYNFCKIEDGSLMPSIDMRRYSMDSGQVVNNITIQELAALHPKIKKLDLTNCKEVSDVGFWALARHCIYLQVLNCHGCEKITTVGIRSISLRCSDILELDFSYCDMIDDMSLTVLAGGTWKIQKINLQHCYRITDNGIAKIAQGLGPYLTHLNINGCPNIGEFGDRGLKELGLHCHLLEELQVDSAKRVEDAGVILLAKGCPKLQTLLLSGCENISKKALRACCDSFSFMKSLKFVYNRKLQDMDYQVIMGSNLRSCMKQLELEDFDSLTDKAVAVICKSMGEKLLRLHLVSCKNITDYSALLIANFCPELRELDLRNCVHLTDEAIHALARRAEKLTSLKVDGNPKITAKALMKHINRPFEFVEMASHWFGYQPKPQVEKLIAKKEEDAIRNQKAIKIQCMVRRRFADRIYWERHRERLLQQAIPMFQAQVRGMLQRKRYRNILYQMHRIKAVVKIQSKWRKYSALCKRIAIMKERKYQQYLYKLSVLIQKLYRGRIGRKKTADIRVKRANQAMEESRVRAKHELRANLIQRIFRGFVGKKISKEKYRLREIQRKRKALEERSMRLIQRIAHGKLGRIKMQHRRREVELAQKRWYAAIEWQRVYRGHLGRLRFQRAKRADEIRKQNIAATHIQRIYRGYRGKLLGAVAKALLILRTKQQFCALEIQRFLRGCMGRYYFKIHRDIETRRRVEINNAKLIQRVFRGHKGREAAEIEAALQKLENQAKPLIDHLHKLEREAAKLRKTISRLEGMEKIMSDNLFQIERELQQCMLTTNKYTDSARINSTPQRFLTKYLRVRLKDHFDHETEIHRLKHIELQARRADLRDIEKDILLTQRELIPLTTGLITEVKRARAQKLRNIIWRRRDAAKAIQALWRRALVRCALYDPYKEGWVMRIDRSQSDHPYYLNTLSKEIRWEKPIAYWFFGERTVSAMDTMNHNQY